MLGVWDLKFKTAFLFLFVGCCLFTPAHSAFALDIEQCGLTCNDGTVGTCTPLCTVVSSTGCTTYGILYSDCRTHGGYLSASSGDDYFCSTYSSVCGSNSGGDSEVTSVSLGATNDSNSYQYSCSDGSNLLTGEVCTQITPTPTPICTTTYVPCGCGAAPPGGGTCTDQNNPPQGEQDGSDVLSCTYADSCGNANGCGTYTYTFLCGDEGNCTGYSTSGTYTGGPGQTAVTTCATPTPAAPTATPVPSCTPALISCSCGTPPPGLTSNNDGTGNYGPMYADSCGNLSCQETCVDSTYGAPATPTGLHGGGIHPCVTGIPGTCDGTYCPGGSTCPDPTGAACCETVGSCTHTETGPGYTVIGCGVTGTTPTATPTATPPSGSIITVTDLGGTGGVFGNVVINYLGLPTVTHTFQFTNTSTITSASGCTVSGLSSQFANVADTCTLMGGLSPLQSCSITVQGTPTSLGNQSSSLTLSCASGGSVSENLLETGVNWPAFSYSTSIHDFGTLAAGVSSSPFPVTISNTSTSNMLFGNNCTVTSSDPNFSVTPSNPNACPNMATTGTCAITLTANSPSSPAQLVYYTALSVSCLGVSDPNYISFSGPPAPFTATSALATSGAGAGQGQFQFETGCSITGQYIPTGSSTCQCPVGYVVTKTFSSGNACRPILPSLEFYQAADGVNTPTSGLFSDGYPVCGPGRLPTASNYATYDFASASGYTPWSSSSVANAASPSYPYNYAYAGTGVAPNPVYLYSNLNRCVCGETGYTQITQSTGQGTTLATSNPSYITTNSGNARFAPDTYEQITAVNTTTVGTIDYAEVVIANDNQSNGYIGSVYESPGAAACGCPNVNENALSIDPSASSITGMVCRTMLNLSDAATNAYKIFPVYNPAYHANSVPTQKFSAEANNLTSVKLPSGTTYQNYSRRIWTCAPPMEPVFSSNAITCQFIQAHHTCDDGTSSGNPSVVSTNAHPLTGTSAQKFDNTVNKRLACCLNQFDPNNPNAFQKFDCVDNSTTSYSTFNDLWSSSTEGFSNAIALTNASGQSVTGFYGLDGTRCGEFSEFAGQITTTKVNQSIQSAQQNLAAGGGATSIDTCLYQFEKTPDQCG
jgi:hypothetical protein